MIFGQAPIDGGVPVRTVLAQTRTKAQRDQLLAQAIETRFVPTATVKTWDSYPDPAGGGVTIWDLRGTMFAADVGRLLAVVVDGRSLLSVVGGCPVKFDTVRVSRPGDGGGVDGERRLGVEVMAHWQRVYDYFGLPYPRELQFTVRWPRDADRVRQWQESDVRASLANRDTTVPQAVLVRDVVTHLTVKEANGDPPPIAPLLAWLGVRPGRLHSLVLKSIIRRVQSPAFAALVATTWPALRTATLTVANATPGVLVRWPNLRELVLATTDGGGEVATVDLGGLAKLRKLTLVGLWQLAPNLSLPLLTQLELGLVTHLETAQLPQLRLVTLHQWPQVYGRWPLLESLQLGPTFGVYGLSLDALLAAAPGWPLLHTLWLLSHARDSHMQPGNVARRLAKVSAWPLLTHLRFSAQDAPWRLTPEVDADWVTPLARAEFWPNLHTLELRGQVVRKGQSLAPLVFDPHRTALTHLSLSRTAVDDESLHSLVTPPAEVLAMPRRTRQLPLPVAKLRSLELDYNDERLPELARRLAHLPTSLETLTLTLLDTLDMDMVAAQWRQVHARQLYPRLRVVSLTRAQPAQVLAKNTHTHTRFDFFSS